MLTKSLNNWSYSLAGFTHNIFKCCCFIDSHKTSVLFLEMEWQISCFNHVCFKEIHSNYPPIWFSMWFEEGLGLTVGFQINLHFQYTFQGNIQICWNYMYVAAQWSTAGSFRVSKQLKRKADCWTEALNPNNSKKQSDIRPNSGLFTHVCKFLNFWKESFWRVMIHDLYMVQTT